MPQSWVRLCARRETMSDETQDRELFKRLVIKPLQWELNDSPAPATEQEQGQFYNATAD
jgi:hypothetical protein